MEYNIFIYTSFYSDFELLKTNIPIEYIDYFMFMYINQEFLKLDFNKIIENTGYMFISLGSDADMLYSDIDNYDIKKEYFIDNLLIEY